jgi:hypothetical protein
MGGVWREGSGQRGWGVGAVVSLATWVEAQLYRCFYRRDNNDVSVLLEGQQRQPPVCMLVGRNHVLPHFLSVPSVRDYVCTGILRLSSIPVVSGMCNVWVWPAPA